MSEAVKKLASMIVDEANETIGAQGLEIPFAQEFRKTLDIVMRLIEDGVIDVNDRDTIVEAANMAFELFLKDKVPSGVDAVWTLLMPSAVDAILALVE